MIGWLRKEKGLYVEVYKNGECCYGLSATVNTEHDGEIDAYIEPSDNYEQLELAAINAALNYLEKGKR